MDYANLDWAAGADNVPGLSGAVYFARKSEIAAWPALVDAPTSAAEASTLAGDFTMVTDKVFTKLFVDVDKSPVTAEVQGEKYCRSFLNKATFKYPGTNEEATAFCRLVVNDDLVFLVKEGSSGKWRVIGNDNFQCDAMPNFAIGGAATDDKGLTIEVSVTDTVPAPFYDGAIVTADGDINPAA